MKMYRSNFRVNSLSQVRQHTDLPFVLDENMDSIQAVLTAHAQNACDVINVKISRLGGLYKAKFVSFVAATY